MQMNYKFEHIYVIYMHDKDGNLLLAAVNENVQRTTGAKPTKAFVVFTSKITFSA